MTLTCKDVWCPLAKGRDDLIETTLTQKRYPDTHQEPSRGSFWPLSFLSFQLNKTPHRAKTCASSISSFIWLKNIWLSVLRRFAAHNWSCSVSCPALFLDSCCRSWKDAAISNWVLFTLEATWLFPPSTYSKPAELKSRLFTCQTKFERKAVCR